MSISKTMLKKYPLKIKIYEDLADQVKDNYASKDAVFIPIKGEKYK